MSVVKTDRKTDRGQCERLNAAIPRPLTSVSPIEPLTGDWLNLNERTSNVDVNNHVADKPSHRLGLSEMHYLFYRLLPTPYFRKLAY